MWLIYVVPFEYLQTVGGSIPSRVYYQVSSGHELVGSFSKSSCICEGLLSICHMLDVENLNGLYLLVFTYDGVSRFFVRAFAESFLETRIGPTLGELSQFITFSSPYNCLSCCSFVLNLDFDNVKYVFRSNF